jgi:hypothetical protein
VTGGWITQADRERWQRDAVRELAAILDAHPGLPLIAWAVSQAGGSLAGQGAGPAAGAAFAAWRQALGLDDVTGVPASGGSPARLRARAWRGGVRITVTAAVAGEAVS